MHLMCLIYTNMLGRNWSIAMENHAENPFGTGYWCCLVGLSGTNVKHNRDLDFMLCQALKKTEAVGTKSQYQVTHCLLAQACSDFLLKALAIVF